MADEQVRSLQVSVVIPTFNSSHTIARTLESVLQQSLSDIEIIVVDDGSTDALDEALAPFFRRDRRIRMVRQENRGLAGARNRGIHEASASLIGCIDADDVWHPDFLAACAAALDTDTAAPFAYAYSFRLDEVDRVFPLVVPRRAPRHDFAGLLSLNSVANGSSMLFRRASLMEVGGFDETMRNNGLQGAEDWKLVLQLARRATPALVARPLVGYRLTTTSMSQRDPARQLRAILAVLEEVRANWPDVSGQLLRDARTMMIAWLLPAFLRNRDYRGFLSEWMRAYLANPAWPLNPSLFGAHVRWLKTVLLSAFSRFEPERSRLVPLADLELEGKRPFAYFRTERR